MFYTVMFEKGQTVCLLGYLLFFHMSFFALILYFHKMHLTRTKIHTHCCPLHHSVNVHFEQHLQHSPKRAMRWRKEQLSGNHLFVYLCVRECVCNCL